MCSSKLLRRMPTVGLILLSVITACVSYHPMDLTEIEQLTTCKNTTTAQIKKNLLLAGYRILSASDEDISTDYKQVGGHSINREYRAINVVKIDDRTHKFKVMVREEGVTTRESPSETRDYRNGKLVTVQQAHREYIPTKQESATTYYKEERHTHESTYAEVCSTGAPMPSVAVPDIKVPESTK